MKSDLKERLIQSQDKQGILFCDESINRVVWNDKLCSVKISTEYLILTEKKSKIVLCCVKLSDIIGCRESISTKHTAHSFDHRWVDVFSYPRSPARFFNKKSSPRRQRRVLSFAVMNSFACENLINVIRCAARGLPISLGPSQLYAPPAPKKLLVFINPVGGTGKAVQVWRKESEQLFQEASVECEVVVTERADHAKASCASRDFTGVAGIVIVGGDGLIFEVVSGLASRPGGGAELMRRLPLIPIPAGSGNGLAKSLTFECGEECSATAAAFIAIKGLPTPVDVSRVTTTSGKEFSSFLLFGWVSACADLEEWTCPALSCSALSLLPYPALSCPILPCPALCLQHAD